MWSNPCSIGPARRLALFALGQHDALQQAAKPLHPGDGLVTFLDDLNVVTMPKQALLRPGSRKAKRERLTASEA